MVFLVVNHEVNPGALALDSLAADFTKNDARAAKMLGFQMPLGFCQHILDVAILGRKRTEKCRKMSAEKCR